MEVHRSERQTALSGARRDTGPLNAEFVDVNLTNSLASISNAAALLPTRPR